MKSFNEASNEEIHWLLPRGIDVRIWKDGRKEAWATVDALHGPEDADWHWPSCEATRSADETFRLDDYVNNGRGPSEILLCKSDSWSGLFRGFLTPSEQRDMSERAGEIGLLF